MLLYSFINPRISAFLLILTVLVIAGCKKDEPASEVPNDPPLIKFFKPDVDMISVSVDDELEIQVVVKDDDGNLYKSFVYYENSLVYESGEYSYGFTLKGCFTPGQQTLKAMALDSRGARSEIAYRTINVMEPDEFKVHLFIDSYSPTMYQGDDLDIIVSGNSPFGEIKSAELFVNDSLFGTSDTEPYEFLWDNISVGTYKLRAKMTDDKGHIAYSEETDLSVEICSAPQITANFEQWDVLYPGNNYSLDINIYGSPCSIDNTFLYLNDVLVASNEGDDLDYDWNNVQPGDYTIKTTAYNVSGVSATVEADIVVPQGTNVDSYVNKVIASGNQEKMFALSYNDHKLIVFDPTNQTPAEVINLPYGKLADADFSTVDNKLYILYIDQSSIAVFDASSSSVTTVSFNYTYQCLDIEVDELHRRIYIMSYDHVYIFDMDTFDVISDNENIYENQMVMNEEQQWIYTIYASTTQGQYNKLRKYSVEGDVMQQIDSLEIPYNYNDQLTISPDGSQIAVSTKLSNNYDIFLFDAYDFGNPPEHFIIGKEIHDFCFDGTGQYIYVFTEMSNDNFLLKCEKSTGAIVDELCFYYNNSDGYVAVSAGGEKLVVAVNNYYGKNLLYFDTE